MIKEIMPGMTNKEKRSVRIHNAKLRGTHKKEQFELLKIACGGSCVICGTTEYKLEKDHIKPLYQGGCDCIFNIQPLCARCNASKGPDNNDYRPEEWKKYMELNNALL